VRFFYFNASKKDVPIVGISALKLFDMVAPKSAKVSLIPKCFGD
jgi:hypothetical protein